VAFSPSCFVGLGVAHVSIPKGPLWELADQREAVGGFVF